MNLHIINHTFIRKRMPRNYKFMAKDVFILISSFLFKLQAPANICTSYVLSQNVMHVALRLYYDIDRGINLHVKKVYFYLV